MEIVNLLPPHGKKEGKIAINLMKIQPCKMHCSYWILVPVLLPGWISEVHLLKVILVLTKVLFSCIKIQFNCSLKWSTGLI